MRGLWRCSGKNLTLTMMMTRVQATEGSPETSTTLRVHPAASAASGLPEGVLHPEDISTWNCTWSFWGLYYSEAFHSPNAKVSDSESDAFGNSSPKSLSFLTQLYPPPRWKCVTPLHKSGWLYIATNIHACDPNQLERWSRPLQRI